MEQAERHFLGHDLGWPVFVPSTMNSVDDFRYDGTGLYTLRIALPPATRPIGWSFGLRQRGVDYAYLNRRRQSAKEEEAAYGLSVAVLAIGAEFAYDSKRLATRLQPMGSV